MKKAESSETRRIVLGPKHSLLFKFNRCHQIPCFMIFTHERPDVNSRRRGIIGKKVADGLGGESEAIRAIREKDIASLSEIDGISLDRAIRMVSEFSGGVENAARNKDGQKLHNAMIHDIEPFISSSPGKRKLRILQPLSVDSIEEINDRRDRVSEAISFISKYPEAVKIGLELQSR